MILFDTGPLVALCDRRDAKHRAAVSQLTALVDNDLAVCDGVLTEACFHLPSRPQRQRLRTFLEEMNVRVLPAVNDLSFSLEVFAWLDHYAEHEPDWADACLAVLSGRDDRLRIWTYDREFTTMWRRPDGTVIPLAV